LSSLLCLCLLFNNIRDKGTTGSAWKQGGEKGRGWGRGAGKRNEPMYPHVNKCIIIIKKKILSYISL
jgi:hypothetical protein